MEHATKTISDTNFQFGIAKDFGDTLMIKWEGECWHGYPGCPGRQFFGPSFERTEFIQAYRHDADGTPVFSLPDNIEIG